MKKYFFIFIFSVLFLNSSLFSQADSVWKFHNSSIDSMKVYLRFHHFHKRIFFYETGIRKEKIIRRMFLKKIIAIHYNESGKKISKTFCKRNGIEVILIEWDGIVRKKLVITPGHF